MIVSFLRRPACRLKLAASGPGAVFYFSIAGCAGPALLRARCSRLYFYTCSTGNQLSSLKTFSTSFVYIDPISSKSPTSEPLTRTSRVLRTPRPTIGDSLTMPETGGLLPMWLCRILSPFFISLMFIFFPWFVVPYLF